MFPSACPSYLGVIGKLTQCVVFQWWITTSGRTSSATTAEGNFGSKSPVQTRSLFQGVLCGRLVLVKLEKLLDAGHLQGSANAIRDRDQSKAATLFLVVNVRSD